MAYVNTLFNNNFLEYASYVIKDRAIPDIEDGLKPVQRRILHTLLEVDDGKFHKVANVVGHCMKYHPHGDASIYAALVSLANKDLFIDKQGNFGNVFTGDEASAARYIECRILPFAKRVLHNPELTEYVDSYDGRNREPVTFPAKLPLVLVLGADGIAVGMSTRILPHNLIEVMQAMQARLRGEQVELYPDFPGGGLVDVSEYDDGQGKVLCRARIDTSDPKRIVIREVPFGTTTESLIQSIENAARRGKVKIQSIQDYTGEDVEIEIRLARGVYAQDVVDALYAFTDCEVAISTNLLVIRDNRPVSMTIPEIIDYHSERLVEILRLELENERGHLLDDLHARTLERIFIEERLYKRIEEEKTQDAIMSTVIEGFEPYKKEIRRKVTEEDVERLLKIPIRRISRYDIERARQEMKKIRDRLDVVKQHLSDLVTYAVDYLDTLIEAESERHARRTEVTEFARVDAREAAARNLSLRYDEKSGYLGYGVAGGKELFKVSEFDRVLIMRKTGTYQVIRVPEKLFVDRGMLACGLADKEQLSKRVFNIVYADAKTGYPYLKRCRIETYILGRSYDVVPKGVKILAVSSREQIAAYVRFEAGPRSKKTEEAFPVENYLVKSAKARGVRLQAKKVKTARFVSVESKIASEAMNGG